jgi:hypothetical protein
MIFKKNLLTFKLFIVLFSILFAYFLSNIVLLFFENYVDTDLDNYTANLVYLSDLNRADSGSFFFYYVLSILSQFLFGSNDVEPYVLFHAVAFISTFIVTLACTWNIRNLNHFLLLFPLIFMVIMSPKLLDVVASNLRAGLALGIFLYAVELLHGYKKIPILILSALMHLSMAPLIGLYVLFQIMDKKAFFRTKPKFLLFFVLVIVTLLGAYTMKIFHPLPLWSNGPLYMLSIFLLLIFIIILKKNIVKSTEGYMFIGIMLLVLWSFMLDYGAIRFFSYALPFIILLAVKNPNKTFIYKLIIGYFPFFILYQYYWLSNSIDLNLL